MFLLPEFCVIADEYYFVGIAGQGTDNIFNMIFIEKFNNSHIFTSFRNFNSADYGVTADAECHTVNDFTR